MALLPHHQADHRALLDVEHATLDQILVHDCVEPGVIDDVVDVTIDVVIDPARSDGEEMPVVGTAVRRSAGHAAARTSACSRMSGGSGTEQRVAVSMCTPTRSVTATSSPLSPSYMRRRKRPVSGLIYSTSEVIRI